MNTKSQSCFFIQPDISEEDIHQNQVKNINEIIKQNDINQAAFANKVGISASTLCRMLSKDGKMSFEIAVKIAQKFKAPLTFILGLTSIFEQEVQPDESVLAQIEQASNDGMSVDKWTHFEQYVNIFPIPGEDDFLFSRRAQASLAEIKSFNEYRRMQAFNLLSLRQKEKVSQQRLSEKTGIPRTTLSKMENGTKEITLYEAILIHKQLPCNLAYLLGIYDERQNELYSTYPQEAIRAITRLAKLAPEVKQLAFQYLLLLSKSSNAVFYSFQIKELPF